MIDCQITLTHIAIGDTPVEKLMGIVAMKLSFNKGDLKQDLELLRQRNIRTAGELYDLYDDINEWNELKLPLLVKIELEELLPDVEVPDAKSPRLEEAGRSNNDITPLLRPGQANNRPGTPSKDRPKRDFAEVPVEKNRGCQCIVM